jgi:ribosomal protein S18 acetylase RimI-like enzyme
MKQEYIGLAWDFHVNPDSCENPSHYEQYLKLSSITDNKTGFSKTHVYIEETEDKQRIIGFISLRCTSVLIKDETIINGHSALEIYELAVQMGYERQGVGTALIDLALSKSEEINTRFAGVEYLTLYSDPKSVGFYVGQNFDPISNMYILPKAIGNANCVPMIMKLYCYGDL